MIPLNGTIGKQSDGSIIDRNGLIISAKEAANIVGNVSELPVMQVRDNIVGLLSQGKDLIIDAATGSGKSTLVPIFAREATGSRVVQTVPRVLSAMSLGEWISRYLVSRTGNPDYTLGYKEVGYRTGSGKSSTSTSNLSIHTDGLEMMREMFSKIMPDVLILDEVQNLSIATEILLFIHKHKLDTQIIIMSATLDPKIYQLYMELSGRNLEVINIPGKVFPIIEYMENIGNPIDKTIELAKSGKHTLHFVAGKSRMDTVIEALKKELGHGYEIMALHAEMTKEEQFLAVLNPPEGITRILVATNVAEESLTLAYLNAVVDEGKHKVGYVNHQGIPELRIEAATKANTFQRRGRVGRVQEGEYWNYGPDKFDDLNDYPSAAIERTLLEREILLFQKAGIPLYNQISRAQDKGGEAFLHPVNKSLLNIGIERLEQIGALDEFGNITPLGEDLLTIGLEPSHARMVIEGIKRGVAEEMIAIAAIFSCNSFISKDGKWKDIQPGVNKKSDFFLYLDLFDLMTKTQINQEILQRLVYPLGLDAEQVKEFDTPGNTRSFFEIVDLSPIGIKNHRITQISNKITQLQNSLIDRGIQIDKKKPISGKQIHIRDGQNGEKSIIENILVSISSGYPYYEFNYDPSMKRLFQIKNNQTTVSGDAFKQASISSVKLTPGKSYIGVPFIIGSDEISDDLGLGGGVDDFFESREATMQEDLCILSHITEISECHIKLAKETQLQYSESIFNKRKNKVSTPNNSEEYQMMYASLGDDFGNGLISREDFLINGVPLLLIFKNFQFKKFLEKKGMDTFKATQQRLQKFFEMNKIDYIHRITARIDSIESSFGGDSDIYEAYRDWEQKNVNNNKKNRRKHIPEAEAEEMRLEIEKHNKNTDLQNHIGLLRGLINSIDRSKLGRKVKIHLGTFIQEIISSGTTYNRMLIVYQDEFGKLSEQEKRHKITQLSEVENSSTQMRSHRTRIDQISSAIKYISEILEYTESPIPANFKKANLDRVVDYFGKPKNQDTLSKAQKDKFYKSVTAVRDHNNDRSGSVRIQRALGRANNSFKSILRELQGKLEIAKQAANIKSQEISDKKTNIFAIRSELEIFFGKYYDPEYFETIIRKKIAEIIKEILVTGDFEITIERWIMEEFSYNKLKDLVRTKNITNHVALEGQLEKELNAIQRKIDTHNKRESSIDQIINLDNEIITATTKIGDIKSKLLT